MPERKFFHDMMIIRVRNITCGYMRLYPLSVTHKKSEEKTIPFLYELCIYLSKPGTNFATKFSKLRIHN